MSPQPLEYKVFAALLQRRLANGLDHLLRNTQYGFRKNRSTQQPIFIIRRIMEMYERGDWALIPN